MSKNNEQLTLIHENNQADNGPVVCLGRKFNNDNERREYFRDELREKLPELKGIEGYPIGEDEEIIALSDPPYYTACPNPWINDFIDEWEKEKVAKYGGSENVDYHREPFAADVSEGKSDPIYNAHSYHTKVPHKAIMRYMLHYTSPGDLILDIFSGTGMTGVAANLCDNKEEIEKLGFIVEGINIKSKSGDIITKKGKRNVILNDISPTATLITNSYLASVKSKNDFLKVGNEVLNQIEEEIGWMFKTKVDDKYYNINYSVWSDVFNCNECTKELLYWDIAVDIEKKIMRDEMFCPNCHSKVIKKDLNRTFITIFDKALDKIIKVPAQKLVLINYSDGKSRYNKIPDEYDFKLYNKVEEMNFKYSYPLVELKDGDKTIEPIRIGLKYVHQLYTRRNLYVIAMFIEKIKNTKYENLLLNTLRSSLSYSNKMVKVNVPRLLDKGGLFAFGFVSGTYYIPSITGERPIIDALKSKLSSISKIIFEEKNQYCVTTQSASHFFNLKDNSIDYIFIDPPFGANLMYSELNFLWEAWLNIYTNNIDEAIINKSQNKNIQDYKELMTKSFLNCFRVLKHGKWITIEFSNSQSTVWNAIQEALQKVGFVIANVSVLDKKQGSFNAITSTTAVKQDLVISAYKPKFENIEKIKNEQNTIESAWTFVNQHLEQLPVFIGIKGEAQIISERTPRILFDRMVAYHVQNGISVPISSAEFQVGISQRFPMRDGMAFLESQIAEYDKKRTLVSEFAQMSLFVSDENSAIEWIRQQLIKKPQTRQDIHPSFMKEIQHIAKHELLPELDDLLNQNFLLYDGERQVPDQIISYLRRTYKDLRGLDATDPVVVQKSINRWYVPDPNKQADLEKLREKSLLREFESYVVELENSKGKKKLKQFRTESIRVGFKKAYSEKDFEKIVEIGKRLPESVIQEDDKLLMYFDNACVRLGL
ncbi:DNA methyltransferase [Bacillus sp. AFS017336]|uniref:DNA methyltransferase n=1 Tax=Bacillus sp. AFS017336 TaxID=2033489 RepID=UPI000BF20A45|nr:DNA methyltransferase [Bacillus sp. AFS017336]PEK99502.1 DNA methylase [Bacillus sp. AFS017336]